MSLRIHLPADRQSEHGVSILIIAVAMVFILGMAGLAIDLASMYVARSQAQRAADAAALAGAQALVDNLCVSGNGGTVSSTCVSLAQQKAVAIADQNLVAGESPNVQITDVQCLSPCSVNDPQIQVVAGRGTYNGSDHGNPLPTFFMKIFGITSVNISAQATAEAFNPSGTGLSMGTTCVKPWMFPNCDEFNPVTTADSLVDCNQSNGPVGPFISGNPPQVVRPQNYPNGAIGEPYMIKPGSPGQAAAPGQYFIAYLPTSGSIPTQCPNCAVAQPPVGGVGSGAIYQENIECCNTNPIYCGQQLQLNTTLQTSSGNKAGPTTAGVECLINQNTGSSNCGQDYIQGISTSPCNDPSPADAKNLPQLPQIPPTIMPGPNNPYNPNGTTPIAYANSSSVVVAPIFDGVIASGQNTVTVAGFVQLFIRDVQAQGNPKGTVYAYVLNISACGGSGSNSTGSGSNGTVTGVSGTAIPVRLVHE